MMWFWNYYSSKRLVRCTYKLSKFRLVYLYLTLLLGNKLIDNVFFKIVQFYIVFIWVIELTTMYTIFSKIRYYQTCKHRLIKQNVIWRYLGTKYTVILISTLPYWQRLSEGYRHALNFFNSHQYKGFCTVHHVPDFFFWIISIVFNQNHRWMDPS